jgi:hypothetical protein
MQNKLLPSKLKKLLITIFALLMTVVAIVVISIFLAKYVIPDDLSPVKNQIPLTIDNVNIITMSSNLSNRVVENVQLVINQGVISAINPSGTPANKNSQFIDGKNAYVVPGLFDMHVHLYERKYLVLNLAFGVTSVRAMNGQVMNLRWKKELLNHEWLGSNLYISSPILDGIDTNALSQAVASPEEGIRQVRKAKENGYDFIKAYGYLDKESFEAIVDESNKIGMKVAKHGPHPVKGSDWRWLRKMQSLEHVEDIFQGPLNYEFDYDKLQQVVDHIKVLNVPVVPTLETFDHLTQLATNKQVFIDTLELEYLNPLYFDIMQHFTVNRWLNSDERTSQYLIKENQFLKNITRALNDSGVKLLVGSDAGTNHTIPGIATHNEMLLLKESGLSDYEVLKAATINAAETLGVESQYGSIEIGKVADLVLTEENPLSDISYLRKPVAVVKKGQWLSASKLEGLKKSAKNNQSYYWSLIKLLENLADRHFL